MQHIVILGGSYAGVSTAHRLLKQSKKFGAFKITLVSPNTHFYWNMASPRGVIPGQLTDEQLFQPIASGFDQYPKGRFEFILASAKNLDVETKTVKISAATGDRTLQYDFLILATGSRTTDDTPFKGLESTEATKNGLHNFQARVAVAKSIVVAGAGVTGVEVTGELAYEYGGKKEITLIAPGTRVLEEAPTSVSSIATKSLQDLKVAVKYQVKVVGVRELPNGRQELTLSDGTILVADMYIPTFGLKPNSSYIPAKFLNAKGFALVDEYLHLKGTKDVWALGDLADVEFCQFISCDRQSVYLAKAIALVLGDKTPPPYKVASKRFMGLQIGKNSGTGHFGTMRVPSFIIVRARKNLFIENLKPTVTGSLF